MVPATAQPIVLWPLAVYFVLVLVVVTSMLGLSALLGQRHRERATGEPYEGGIAPTGSARLRVSAQFYQMAMFFVIFDLEVVFILAWAIAVRDLGWGAYTAVVVFIAVLGATLFYLWRLGALDWERPRRRARAVHA